MATHNKFNEFGEIMVENRDFAYQLTADDMTRNEWRKYLGICDAISIKAFKYFTDDGTFDDVRSAIHSMFAFVGVDTRILALDANVIRIMARAVPYQWVKSDAYKEADKAKRQFSTAMKWACEVSEVDTDTDTAILFPKADSVNALVAHYFTTENQKNYNAIVGLFKTALASERKLTVADLKSELKRLVDILEDIKAQPKQYYRDYVDPTKPKSKNSKKAAKHVPDIVRKDIEDAMGTMLAERSVMTEAQLAKEEAQIKGGKLQQKQAKEATAK